jgi:hypothetical protein
MSNDKNTTHYELPAGAIAILDAIMPTNTWYKEEPKQAAMIVHSVAAVEELPDLGERLKPEKDETQTSFDARVDAWSARNFEFDWSDKQKNAAKKCVQFYLKQGALDAKPAIVALLKLLQLTDDE